METNAGLLAVLVREKIVPQHATLDDVKKRMSEIEIQASSATPTLDGQFCACGSPTMVGWQIISEKTTLTVLGYFKMRLCMTCQATEVYPGATR